MIGVTVLKDAALMCDSGRPQSVIGVANFKMCDSGRPQSVIGVANFKDVRQWKAPKCDRGSRI